MRLLVGLVGLLACAACRAPRTDDERASDLPVEAVIDIGDGLRGPESVVHDTVADVYLVSNINGSPPSRDDNGYISRIAPDGTMLAERWIDGARPEVTLHAPRGLAIHGDVLYVVDADAVRLFSRVTGAPIAAWPIPDPHFPNDLRVADDGSVYVTETAIHLDMRGPVVEATPMIWKFSPDGVPSVFARGDYLQGPNGIVLADHGDVIVAAFYGHEVYRLSAGGTKTTLATFPETQLDGLIELPDHSLLVTTWTGNGIYRITPDGNVKLVLHDASMVGPASIGYDAKRQQLLIPLVLADHLWIESFPVTPS